MNYFLVGLDWLFLLFFLGINIGYLLLNMVSLFTIGAHMERHSRRSLPGYRSEFMPPVSLLVPAHNEEGSVVKTVKSLLDLTYPEFEIVVVNDGSDDNTLEVLRDEYDLRLSRDVYREQIETEDVHAIYHAQNKPNLRVVDKENGGKSDALNAGINLSVFPLVCSVDADSIMDKEGMINVIQPFLEDDFTVASGGTVRVANGGDIEGHLMRTPRLPESFLPLLQVIEYLRAFLFGRLGWSPLNGLLVISGTFATFQRDVLIEIGGFRRDTVGEDMEVVCRLHRKLSQQGERYRISFVPEPICWTEVPDDLGTLRQQRTRWQRGLTESLLLNVGLPIRGWGTAAGWLAYPFLLIFECLGPLFEVGGYLYVILGLIFGFVSVPYLIAFLLVAVGFGFLLSLVAFLLEEISFGVYRERGSLFRLCIASVVENFGYRQVQSLWRLHGLILGLFGKRTRGGWREREAIDPDEE